MKTLLIATTAVIIGFGASTLTANAQAEYTGQNVYTQSEPSRFAPAGIPTGEAAARDEEGDRRFINSRKDSYHKAY